MQCKFHYESSVVSITDKGVYIASPDGTEKHSSISFVPGDLIIVSLCLLKYYVSLVIAISLESNLWLQNWL